jgi:putative Mg2+ transporter-C (MgtC) family protein
MRVGIISDMESLEFLFQLTLAVLLGSFVGIEREIAKKTAGMRTFALVSLGSALFTILSLYGITAANVDPTRIAAQIVVGVGFIGAGLIIFDPSKKLQGVTTAGGLWVASAIGMAVGFRLYTLAIFTALLALLVFTVFWRFEEGVLRKELPFFKPKRKKAAKK